MKRLFWFLIDGCWHRWKRLPGFMDHYDISFGGRSWMWRSFPCRCEKCGKLGQLKDYTGALDMPDLED